MAEIVAAPRRGSGLTPESDTYRALLQAARNVIRERGYARATVEDIRRAAGVSRATFYFYFQDKRQILLRLLSDTTQEYVDLSKRKYPHRDAYGRIVQTHVEYFAHFSRDADLMAAVNVLASHDPAFAEGVEDVRRGYRSRVQRHIERLIDGGRIPATDSGMLSLILIGMVEKFTAEFFRIYRTEDDIKSNIAAAIAVLSQTWYRALYAEEPPASFPYDDLLSEVEIHGVS